MSEWKDIVSEDIKFVIPKGLLIHLETWISSAGGREVSGVGIMEADSEKKTFTLKKCWLMAAGSTVYTEIPAARMANLVKDGINPSDIKVWWHRHPVGNGIPGSHNWSGTDNNTIRNEPFGIDPEMVQWLVSIVRTPRGWVGRYDNHLKKETTHMEVQTVIKQSEYNSARTLIEKSSAIQEPKTYKTWDESRPPSFAPTRRSWDNKLNSQQAAKDAYREHAKKRIKQLGLQGSFGSGDSPIENQLKKAGWDRQTYEDVSSQLAYELPEFVAFDNAVTLREIHAVGLLNSEELNLVLNRIQERVDKNDAVYLKMIANWELADF